jgi:hypothetical protein
VDAARTLHRQAVREMLDRAAAGDAFGELDRARFRRDKAFVARLCVGCPPRCGRRSTYHGDADAEEPEDEPTERSLQHGHHEVALDRGADDRGELVEQGLAVLCAQRHGILDTKGERVSVADAAGGAFRPWPVTTTIAPASGATA